MAIDPAKPDPAIARYLDLARRFRSEPREIEAFHAVTGEKSFVRSAGLTEFQDATVLSGEWLVIAGGRIFCDFLVQTPSPPMTAYLTRFDLNDDVIDLIHETPRDLGVPGAFLLGGCRNYCHWLLDYLPRVQLLRDPSLPLLVNGPLQPFQLESLRRLGFGDDRVIQLEYPGAWSVRRLLYPGLCSSVITPPHAFQPMVLDWLRDTFAPSMPSGRGERKLFISRAGETADHRRRLLNHAEIAGIAERHGFEIVAPETLTFADQVSLFSRAGVIAGAHGAGFANMVFAPRGTALVELIGPRLHRSAWSLPYTGIARLLGQNVTRIVGQSDESTAIPFDHLPHETYRIDAGEFEHVLRALESGV